MDGRSSASTSDLNLEPPPHTSIDQLYHKLSPSTQAAMAPYMQRTMMAGVSSSTHPAVSSHHPEKGRPMQLPRYQLPNSFLPKDFAKQQQLITISSEESDDDDDDIQIDNRLSAPRVIRDSNLTSMLAKQHGLLSHPSETSRIPLPQQQLHNSLSGVKPFIPPVLPGGVHQAVQTVQHRGIPAVSLGPPPDLGLK